MKKHHITNLIICIGCILAGEKSAQAGLIASDSTANSITIHWTAPGDDTTSGTASQYDIRYSTSNITDANWAAATQVSGEPAPHVAGTAESMVITGLSPSTIYYFAIKTADEVPNWSAISNIAHSSTAPETFPPSNIVSLAVSNPTGISMRLTWTAPGDDSTSGTAAQYDIRYSTSPINDANWAAASQSTGEPAPAVAGTQQTFTVTGLLPNRTYYFAMKTADEVPNWSGLSNVPSGTTLDNTPPSAINDLHAFISEDSIPHRSYALVNSIALAICREEA